MSSTRNERRMPGGPDRDEELLRNLYNELRRAADRENRLYDRLEETIGAVREIERNQKDIKEVHRDLYGREGLMSRVDVLEKHPTFRVDNGGTEDAGVTLSTSSVVSIGLFLVGSALTGLWHVIGWIVSLAQRLSP